MMMRALLPDDVILIEASAFEPVDVMPTEATLVAAASPKRRSEFLLGRTCARRALRQAGLEGWPLLIGRNREPLWPPGFVGSITHTEGYVAAAVASWPPHRSFGIDAERRRPLPSGVAETVCTAAELDGCRFGPAGTDIPWDAVLFSAKESVFKAWSPLVGSWLGYLDAELGLVPDLEDHRTGSIIVDRLAQKPSGLRADELTGRYLVARDVIMTAMVAQRSR